MYEEPELPRGYTRKSSSEKFGDCTCIFETIFSSCVRISTAACFFWITGVLGFRSYWCFFQPGSDTRGETLHSGYTFFSQPLRRKSADVRSGNHTKSLAPGRVREGERLAGGANHCRSGVQVCGESFPFGTVRKEDRAYATTTLRRGFPAFCLPPRLPGGTSETAATH